MQLSNIRLHNIRVFADDVDVPVSRSLTVIMGRNNTGKSTAARAPFLIANRSPSSVPFLAFHRHGAVDSMVGLTFQVTPQECLQMFGFGTSRLGDIRISSTGGSGLNLSLDNMPEFHDWQQHPLVEIGVAYDQQVKARTVRILSNDPGTWVQAASQGKYTRAFYKGSPTITNIDSGWIAGGFESLLHTSKTSMSASVFAYWENHRIEQTTGWILLDSDRRLFDTNEQRLQETLTFLKLKHGTEFERISDAMRRALPEFSRLDFIETSSSGFNYRPGLVSGGGGSELLAREAVGAGVWSYLCILTAARAAKTTGARILVLDEPHLYMHPGLELLLLDELMDESKWDGEPLQIIASTHSPTFVDAAVESGVLNIFDWADKNRTYISVTSVARQTDETVPRKKKIYQYPLDHLFSDPSDLFYSGRLVFVEGPSDIAALRILARERCGVRIPIRYVPLRETDAVKTDLARYFRIVLGSHGASVPLKAILLLDGDKKPTYEKAWSKLGSEDDPSAQKNLQLIWSDGGRGNDLESVFCDEEFLVAYFSASPRDIPETESRPVITRTLPEVKYEQSDPKTKDKGCTAIRKLHQLLLKERYAASSKAEDLETMMTFYTQHADEQYCEIPRELLNPLEQAIRKIALL
ncbi:MAG: hypothetical protein EOP84_10020 [Verrucomicrobiaceae bacterium]|nr:MAG: hypothetical protein EOP84_10020 [Verrucomicrobiaceae bacterium]